MNTLEIINNHTRQHATTATSFATLTELEIAEAEQVTTINVKPERWNHDSTDSSLRATD